MKLLRLQLLIHLRGAYLDKYMDTQGFHICIRRDTYTPPFTQLCVSWLYTCRSLILKRQEVVHDVQGEKKRRDLTVTSRCACAVCSYEEPGYLHTPCENVPIEDLKGVSVPKIRSSPRPQTRSEFCKEGKPLASWCLAPLNKTATSHTGNKIFFPFIHKYVQITKTIAYTSINSEWHPATFMHVLCSHVFRGRVPAQ